MNKILLIKNKERILRKISKTYQVKNLLTTDKCKNLSIAVSKAKKHKEITKNTKSARAYLVLRGKLNIKQGKKKATAYAGDVVFIPKNTKYYFGGTFEAVLLNSPAFSAKFEEIIQKY